MKFEEKIPVVEAFQWDGTDEGAAALSQWFVDNFPNLVVEMEMFSFVTDGGVSHRRITVRSRIQGLTEERISEGMWIIAHDTGVFETTGEREFERRYQAISE